MTDLYSQNQVGMAFTFQDAIEMIKALPKNTKVSFTSLDGLEGKDYQKYGRRHILSPEETIEMMLIQFGRTGNHLYKHSVHEIDEFVIKGKTYMRHRITIKMGEMFGADMAKLPNAKELVIPDLPFAENSFSFLEAKVRRGRIGTFWNGLGKTK